MFPFAAQLFFPILISILLIAGVAHGQSVSCKLVGTVVDKNKDVIVGATVSLHEKDIAKASKTITDSAGNYEFNELKPAIYAIEISAPGFASVIFENVVIENLQSRRIDAELAISGGISQVAVRAGLAPITTEGGSINSSITKNRVADNPTTDTYPFPYSLFTTLPGVQSVYSDLKVSGQNIDQQTIGLDGVINDRYGEQNNNINFYNEATITTVNASAENSRIVNYNLVSKRGDNRFHGMAYYRRFDSAFNARDFFENKKTTRFEHEAQAELSGPIFKNKTYFYASWFYQRIPTGVFRSALVPTLKMRTGDFSDFLSDQTQIIDPLTGETFTNNIIPMARISQVSLGLQEYFPKPNAILANGANYAWVHPFDDDYFRAGFPFIRIDHDFSSRNSLSAKWTQRITPFVLASNVPQLFWTRLRDHGQFGLNDTHVFSEKFINTFIFGWSRDHIADGEDMAGQSPLKGSDVLARTGLQGVNPGNFTGAGFPSIYIGQIQDLATVPGGVKANDHTLSFQDSLTLIKGRHTIKIGAAFNRFSRFSGTVADYGSLSFDGSFTGVPYADFLLGLPVQSSRVFPRSNRAATNREIGVFVSDSFKPFRNLTLDVGLRWDYYGLPQYKDRLQYNFDPATGSLVIPQGTRGEVDEAYPTEINIVEGSVVPRADHRNFRPRLAAAYRFTDSFVLRGGYGQFTERFSRDYFDLAFGDGPFARFAETYNNSITNGVPLYSFPNPFPAGQNGRSPAGAQSVSGEPLQSRDGTIHQFNVTLEKEFHGLGLRASYIGSRGRGLRAFTQINEQRPNTVDEALPRPFPQYRDISYLKNDFASRYDSAQFEVQRRAGSFTFDAHYTYAVNRNNINNSPDPYAPASQWANDWSTRRHMFVVTTQSELPLGKGKLFLSAAPGFVNQIVSNWRVQTVSYFGSGQFVTPYSCGNNQNLYGSFGGGCIRPDLTGDSAGPQTVEKWFNPDAFSVPSPGQYGNAKASSIEGPGLLVTSLSVAKVFPVRENLRMTYTLGIGNVFNTPNFFNPDGDIYCHSDYCGASLYYTLGVGLSSPENAGHRTMYMKLRLEF
jgi:Carboxypeptidase regulatory-like domain/TonB dependent receptor